MNDHRPRAWVGCSGFLYRHWKEVFYPAAVPQRLWFEFYCRHFNTVELNVTFYRIPRLSTFEGWYNRSPEGFHFAVKAPRLVTHYKKFVGTETMITDFYALVQEGLKDKLGCVLFQLPPSLTYSPEKLDQICDSLDPSFQNVVEFRHPSWWNGAVYQQLASRSICFCSISHPTLPDELVINTRLVYYRLHGTPHLYRSLYEATRLEQIASSLMEASQVKQVYVYFNNDIDASALRNAREMQLFMAG